MVQTRRRYWVTASNEVKVLGRMSKMVLKCTTNFFRHVDSLYHLTS